MFCAFSFQAARDLISLILRHAYVSFGDRVYKQVTGIPMGINPGVFVANYYLFAYEFDFMQQLVDLMVRYPPSGGALHPQFAYDTLLSTDPAAVHSRLQGEVGDAALFVLLQFKFMCRYVDDVLSGPNQCLDQLLYTNQTLLGGLVHGVYPDYLHLTDSNPRPMDVDGQLPTAPTSCDMLDTTINVVPVQVPAVGTIVRAYTTLYDKRSKPCFAGLPKGGVVDISSSTTTKVAYSVIPSKLARFAVVCGTLQDFVNQCVTLLCELVHKHYSWPKSWALVRRFVGHGASTTYGETNAFYVLALIKYGVGVELGKITNSLPPPRSHFYAMYRRCKHAYKRWLRLALSCSTWEPLPSM